MHLLSALLGVSFLYPQPRAAAAPKPNIVFILADDLGYGDVHHLNPNGKIATPNLDRLGQAGIAFTDAHSSSAVCTPSRYSLLTGRYNWRSRLKNGVLGGFSPRLIEPGRLTLPAMLKQKGYTTACLGKWHLGMDWQLTGGGVANGDKDGKNVLYGTNILNGPTAVGFDYFFGISASLDMPPYVFIENDRCLSIPTVEKTWIRKGPAAKDFEAIDVLPTLTRKAIQFVTDRAPDARNGKPFFLYLPLASPHTPIVPTAEWQGKSGLNPYADFVMQTDRALGDVLDALDKQHLSTNTLVFFASDNGCSPAADFPALAAKGHQPSYVFRGMKADIFDGGHRIPLLARWLGKIKPGSTSSQLVCLVDLMATCADLLQTDLPANAAEDSISFLPALLGTTGGRRDLVVHHSINGSFAIREGKWKLELCPDSGGWSEPKPGSAKAKTLPPVQLYDLSMDIGEKENLQAKYPEVVSRLTKVLEQYVEEGRSTPGPPQANTGDVRLRRTPGRGS